MLVLFKKTTAYEVRISDWSSDVCSSDLLLAALDEVDADAAMRCLLLTGAGRGFCSGADLASGDLNQGGGLPDHGRALHERYHRSEYPRGGKECSLSLSLPVAAD